VRTQLLSQHKSSDVSVLGITAAISDVSVLSFLEHQKNKIEIHSKAEITNIFFILVK
jgi:hypothetical protein